MENNNFNNFNNFNTSYFYLSHIHSLLNPYRNMKPPTNKLSKLNKIYKPSKLSISYNCNDLYNLKKEEDSKIYYLIYFDENYEKDF